MTSYPYILAKLGKISWYISGFEALFGPASLTAPRTYTLPDGNLSLIAGTYTSAATGDASGLTSGTVSAARLPATAAQALTTTATYAPGLVLMMTTVTTDITLTGASTTGTPTVIITCSDWSQYNGFVVKASVISANTVRVYASNYTTGSLTPASTTIRLTIINN